MVYLLILIVLCGVGVAVAYYSVPEVKTYIDNHIFPLIASQSRKTRRGKQTINSSSDSPSAPQQPALTTKVQKLETLVKQLQAFNKQRLQEEEVLLQKIARLEARINKLDKEISNHIQSGSTMLPFHNEAKSKQPAPTSEATTSHALAIGHIYYAANPSCKQPIGFLPSDWYASRSELTAATYYMELRTASTAKYMLLQEELKKVLYAINYYTDLIEYTETGTSTGHFDITPGLLTLQGGTWVVTQRIKIKAS